MPREAYGLILFVMRDQTAVPALLDKNITVYNEDSALTGSTPSGQAALTHHRCVIHSRSLRVPSGKKRKTAFSGFSFLVTPTGIEPMIAP